MHIALQKIQCSKNKLQFQEGHQWFFLNLCICLGISLHYFSILTTLWILPKQKLGCLHLLNWKIGSKESGNGNKNFCCTFMQWIQNFFRITSSSSQVSILCYLFLFSKSLSPCRFGVTSLNVSFWFITRPSTKLVTLKLSFFKVSYQKYGL